ncbi:hypothetical protein C8J57DRAFT_1501207 [Mycena rebaudengoi]|nr:hypothetical protein C8J57DRAFT_1501207 [Mycena rebaudengoi]
MSPHFTLDEPEMRHHQNTASTESALADRCPIALNCSHLPRNFWLQLQVILCDPPPLAICWVHYGIVSSPPKTLNFNHLRNACSSIKILAHGMLICNKMSARREWQPNITRSTISILSSRRRCMPRNIRQFSFILPPIFPYIITLVFLDPNQGLPMIPVRDASLIEPHAASVLQLVPRDIAATAEAPVTMSTTSRLRATTLTELLFNLVIQRAYLNRSSADDTQVYFLARKYSVKELHNTPSDTPFLVARAGKVIRYGHTLLTVPEGALQAAEGAGNEQIPQMWCRIGTLITKAAGGSIASDFLMARAYSADGLEYPWIDSNRPTSHKNIPATEHVSASPSPLNSHECGAKEADSSDPDEVQCEKCFSWSHIKCLERAYPGTDWNDPQVHSVCSGCGGGRSMVPE